MAHPPRFALSFAITRIAAIRAAAILLGAVSPFVFLAITGMRSACADEQASLLNGMPADVKCIVALSDLKHATEHFQATDIYKLRSELSLQPFLQALEADEEGSPLDARSWLGFDWNELTAASHGGAALAAWPSDEHRTAIVFAARVIGSSAAVQRCLDSAGKNWTARGARRSLTKIGNVQIICYTLRSKTAATPNEHCYAQVDDRLLVCNDANSLAAWLKNQSSPPILPAAFRKILDSSNAGPGPADAADLRWVAEPLALLRMLDAQAVQGRRSPAQKAERLGLDAVSAVGGAVSFHAAGCDLWYRTTVAAKRPFAKGLGVLDMLPNDYEPPPRWVPANVARYADWNWNFRDLFKACGFLFDELIADGESGAFNDMVSGMRTDPDGPRVDLAKDLFGQLGPRVCLVEDEDLDASQRPAGGANPHWALASQADDGAKIATVLKKLYDNDKEIRSETIGNSKLWFTVSPDASLLSEATGSKSFKVRVATVADDRLFWSGNLAMLENLLKRSSSAPSLADAEDYKRVVARRSQWESKRTVMRGFSREYLALRGDYDSLRRGEAQENRSSPIAWLRSLVVRGESGRAAFLVRCGKKLPEFSAIQMRFGLSGTAADSVDDGIQFTGFVLPRGELP